MSNVPFIPEPGKTVNVTVATSSANVQVSADSVRRQVRIMNNSTVTAFVKFGLDNTVAATTTDSFPVASGACEVVTVPQGPIYMAVIGTGTPSGAVYATPGNGI